jgi:HPt (histidine-containing phosphotransfer) domain-containing protein
MDAFLTKPLEVGRLREVLDRFGLAAERIAPSLTDKRTAMEHTDTATLTTQVDAALVAPVDLIRLQDITDGDSEFTQDLIATFIISGQEVLEELGGAMTQDDRPALVRAAHKLKGASANIHAVPLRQLCVALELRATSLSQSELRNLLAQTATEFKLACDYLQATRPNEGKQGAA